MKGKMISSLAVAVLGLALAAMPAVAYDVFPGSNGLPDPTTEGTDLNVDFLSVKPANCNAGCLDTLTGGTFDSSTQTLVNGLYTIDLTDSTFTVTYNGGSFADCGTCFLYVKDGNLDPYAYLFDISGWNGTDQIDGSGFWAGVRGGISHVDIYAGGTNVPEPASLMLLGAGLVAIGIWRRKSVKI